MLYDECSRTMPRVKHRMYTIGERVVFADHGTVNYRNELTVVFGYKLIKIGVVPI